MAKFLGQDLWSTIVRIGGEGGRKCAAIAYYSTAVVRFGDGDIIIVDASEDAIRGGQTSARVLLDAFHRGAVVFSHSKLHAKMLIGEREAVVSSANLSARSNGLREAGVLLDGFPELAAAASYFRVLQEEATVLSCKDLENLVALPVELRRPKGTARPSLFEGLKANLSTLDDVAWGYYTRGGCISKADVVAAAQQQAMRLPKGWTWFESVQERGMLGRIRKACGRKPIVHFVARLDANMMIEYFKAQEGFARNLVDALQIDDAVVSIFGPRGILTPFDLRRDGDKVVEVLNRGLARAPVELKERINSQLAIISSKDLRQLFAFGSKD
jgi:hypothetical protein